MLEAPTLREKKDKVKVYPQPRFAPPATVGKTGGRVQCAWLELRDLTLTLSDKSQTTAFLPFPSSSLLRDDSGGCD